MLRITPSTSARGAKEYFTQSLTRDDTGYYHEGQELAGQWGGKGAPLLGLSGPVSQEEFFALCDNRNPENGERLTPRNKEGRRIGFDFTFSAPKSVSLLYEMTGDEKLLDAFRQSYRETMAEMEPEMKTRVRKKGADHDRQSGNMTYAEFVHFTARPVTGKGDGASLPDPHLHAHVYAFNITKDPIEDRWKAGQFGDLKRDATYWEAAFDARLSHRLETLGYATEKRGLSFEIAGIPQSLIDKFSRRRNEIESKAAEKGITDAAGKHAIGYYSREHKKTGLSKAELRAKWNSRLTDDERSALADAIHGRMSGDRTYTADEAKEYALSHSFQNASAVAEKRLKATALKFAPGSVLPEDVADIAQHPEVIARKHDGQLFTTTKTVLRDETDMLQFAKDGQRTQKPFIPAREQLAGKQLNQLEYSRSGIYAESFAGLSPEQQKAGLHILNSRDTVTGIVGKAGTGKTTMMRATRDAIESIPGQHVFALAPSSQASRGVLAKEGFKNAETLAMLLKNEKMQEKTKGQIIWLDEAGQVSAKDMKKLFDIAKKNGNRVILSGDYTQHSSVEAGDAFRLLEKEAGVKLARLTEVRRQTMPGYKKAVEAISQGSGKSAQKGFDSLDNMGWVVEASGEDRHRMLVNDYLKAQEEGRSALIVAPTHAEGDRLTQEVRGALKERGALGAEHQFITRKATGWTDAQKGDVRNYEPGMVLEFHQNAKGFKRGEKLVVIDHSQMPQKAVPKWGRRRGNPESVESRDLVTLKEDGSRITLPLDQAQRFEVYRTRELGIAKGDRIRITKNGEAKVDRQPKGTRINNGDIFTVEGFTKEGDIRIEKGKLLPKDWGHMSLGYVDTSYASQGKTVDRVFIATGSESLPAVNQQGFYVAASRGREMAKIYVDSKEDVRDAIARTGERLSAVELTKTKLRPSWRSRFYESLERNRVGRFLKARAEAIADRWRGREMNYA